MNAVLQCLWLTTKGISGRSKDKSTDLMKEFWCLMNCMSLDQKGPITPSKFKDVLAKRHNRLAVPRQQDAHEFLMVMLEHLAESTENVFSGNTVSVITCTSCNHKTEKQESFTCIDVEIPSTEQSTVSLKECMEAAFAEEIITDGWSCIHCKTADGGVKKEIVLGHVPRMLIIQLKRFKFTGRGYKKDDSKVKLPTNTIKFGNKNFELIGIVNHMGSMDTGHYTANIKVNNCWKRCNDQIIRDEEQLQWNSRVAYLLFLKQLC